jgi:16S rRNA (guanine1516-N2)-methyltransferase
MDAELAPLAIELTKSQPQFTSNLINEFNQVNSDYSLVLTHDGLYLLTPQFKPFNLRIFYEEFIHQRQPSISRELLIQTVKLKTPNQTKTALDLTAGLGRDALLLALAGFEVSLIENNPYLGIILEYLTQVIAPQFNLVMRVFTQNNYDYLSNLNHNYAIIYFDPMFNDGKSSLAKKDMQIISGLIKFNQKISTVIDYSDIDVFNLATTKCEQRIIVKRDNKQAKLVQKPLPNYSKQGKTIRFDVYLC